MLSKQFLLQNIFQWVLTPLNLSITFAITCSRSKILPTYRGISIICQTVKLCRLFTVKTGGNWGRRWGHCRRKTFKGRRISKVKQAALRMTWGRFRSRLDNLFNVVSRVFYTILRLVLIFGRHGWTWKVRKISTTSTWKLEDFWRFFNISISSTTMWAEHMHPEKEKKIDMKLVTINVIQITALCQKLTYRQGMTDRRSFFRDREVIDDLNSKKRSQGDRDRKIRGSRSCDL